MRKSLVFLLGLGLLGSCIANDKDKKNYENFLRKHAVGYAQKNKIMFRRAQNTDAKDSRKDAIKKSLDKLGIIGGFSDWLESIVDDFNSLGGENTKVGFSKKKFEFRYMPRNIINKNVEFGFYGENQQKYSRTNYSFGFTIKIPF